MNPPEGDGEHPVSGVYGAQGELVLSFDNQEPSFSVGFEAGMLWGCLSLSVVGFTMYVRYDNIELAMRMAVAKGFTLRAIGDDDPFAHVEFRRCDGTLPSMPAIETLPEGT